MLMFVSGAAGFIGSHLVDRLLADGHEVIGVDSLTSYYRPDVKRSNLGMATGNPRFRFIEQDLLLSDLPSLLTGVDVLFHQAAQPGVRLSWSQGFQEYVSSNVLVTQKLLEAAKLTGLRRFVYASSSSIYGNANSYPTHENQLPYPHSPYGVTKLAGEQLCNLYAANYGISTVSLRYFTVYGPRQRPDMAIHRLLAATMQEDSPAPFPLYGSGLQVRDFTYVSDVVAANVAAGAADVPPGAVCNIAGGTSSTMIELIDLIGRIVGRQVPLEVLPAEPGDVDRTGGSIERAQALLDWKPRMSFEAGLREQLAWHQGGALSPPSLERKENEALDSEVR